MKYGILLLTCIIVGLYFAFKEIDRETQHVCAWAERADMYDECANAYHKQGRDGAEALRHRYGDPTRE